VALYWLGLYGFHCLCSTAPGAVHCTGSKVTNHFLFPNYLFVRIELQWSQAKFTPGVVRIVLDGAAPATIPSIHHCLSEGARGGRPDRAAEAAAIPGAETTSRSGVAPSLIGSA
jgi:hypothetical protein